VIGTPGTDRGPDGPRQTRCFPGRHLCCR
jgi:hypothetical protein